MSIRQKFFWQYGLMALNQPGLASRWQDYERQVEVNELAIKVFCLRATTRSTFEAPRFMIQPEWWAKGRLSL
jgi:hypothetical protein